MSQSDLALTEAQKRALKIIRKEAMSHAFTATAAGDAAAKRLGDLSNAWEAGLRGEVPEVLRPFMEQARRETDPEWGEYQRLRERFEQ